MITKRRTNPTIGPGGTAGTDATLGSREVTRMLKQNREPGGAQMMTKVTLILLGALIATVPGCAGSRSTDSPSASVAPANVAGTWTGGTATGSRTVTLQLQQMGP